jgi:DNA-binding transcriptional MerR regulator
VSSTIGELSLATGVPIATLRDWDRRHGLSPSQRTIGNHRRYTETDAALVRRVLDLVGQGRRLAASVNQARDDQSADERRGLDPTGLHAASEHARLRADVVANRAEFIAKRDELVLAREALVARRHALVRQHGDTLAVIAGGLTIPEPSPPPESPAPAPSTTTSEV